MPARTAANEDSPRQPHPPHAEPCVRHRHHPPSPPRSHSGHRTSSHYFAASPETSPPLLRSRSGRCASPLPRLRSHSGHRVSPLPQLCSHFGRFCALRNRFVAVSDKTPPIRGPKCPEWLQSVFPSAHNVRNGYEAVGRQPWSVRSGYEAAEPLRSVRNGYKVLKRLCNSP